MVCSIWDHQGNNQLGFQMLAESEQIRAGELAPIAARVGAKAVATSSGLFSYRVRPCSEAG